MAPRTRSGRVRQLDRRDAADTLVTLPVEMLQLIVEACDEDSLRNAYCVCKALCPPVASELRKRCLIALVRPTPGGVQAFALGLFAKRAELVNSYPSYTKAGDASVMLWHAGDSWYVGYTSELGEPRGWVCVADGALTPETVALSWQVFDPNTGEWVVAPELRALAEINQASRHIWCFETGDWVDTSKFALFV